MSLMDMQAILEILTMESFLISSSIKQKLTSILTLIRMVPLDLTIKIQSRCLGSRSRHSTSSRVKTSIYMSGIC